MPNHERIRFFQRVKKGDVLVLNVPEKTARLESPAGTTVTPVHYHESVRWCKKLWRMQEHHEHGETQSAMPEPHTDLTRILVDTTDGVQLALSYLIRERDHPHDVFV